MRDEDGLEVLVLGYSSKAEVEEVEKEIFKKLQTEKTVHHFEKFAILDFSTSAYCFSPHSSHITVD